MQTSVLSAMCQLRFTYVTVVYLFYIFQTISTAALYILVKQKHHKSFGSIYSLGQIITIRRNEKKKKIKCKPRWCVFVLNLRSMTAEQLHSSFSRPFILSELFFYSMQKLHQTFFFLTFLFPNLHRAALQSSTIIGHLLSLTSNLPAYVYLLIDYI